MSYTRKNLLRRIIKIQDIVSEHKRRGVTQKWVFDNVIADQFDISYSTFNNYLSYPAKLELTRMQKNEAAQPTLF